MKVFVLWLDEKVKKDLQALARNKDRSMADLVREAINALLSRKEGKGKR